MIGIYHNEDLDGICCGAILKYKYPDIKLIGINYGDNIPENTNNEEMIICDFSFPIDDMHKISLSCNGKLTWIDHHISAINEFKKYNNRFPINTSLNIKSSACELAWKYFFPNEEMPIIVKLLGIYDTWRQNEQGFDWQDVVFPFQYGLRLECNNIDDFPYSLFEQVSINGVSDIITNGKMILKYQSKQNEKICKSAFDYIFEGLRAICLNIGNGNSMTFETIYNPTQHDIMIAFVFDGVYWSYELYTTKEEIDCSEIAKKYGGGGHKNASGFRIKEFIFK